MIQGLLELVGATLYRGKDAGTWLRDQRALLMVLTWPAVWLNRRGIGLPVADYEARMRGIIQDVAKHGSVAAVKYVPVYLGDCVRKHFAHQGEALYVARKHVRDSIDFALLQGQKMPASAADVVPALVAAHAVLATAKKRGKARSEDDLQGHLF